MGPRQLQDFMCVIQGFSPWAKRFVLPEADTIPLMISSAGCRCRWSLLTQFARLAFSLEQFDVYHEVTEAMRRRCNKSNGITAPGNSSKSGAVDAGAGNGHAATASRSIQSAKDDRGVTLAVFDVLDAVLMLHESGQTKSNNSSAKKTRSGDGTGTSSSSAAHAHTHHHTAAAPSGAALSSTARTRFSTELEPLESATATLVREYTRVGKTSR